MISVAASSHAVAITGNPTAKLLRAAAVSWSRTVSGCGQTGRSVFLSIADCIPQSGGCVMRNLLAAPRIGYLPDFHGGHADTVNNQIIMRREIGGWGGGVVAHLVSSLVSTSPSAE